MRVPTAFARVEAAASPMPSMMRMAARSKPDGKYAERHGPDGGARNEILPKRPSKKLLGDTAHLDRAAVGRPPQTADPPTTRGEIAVSGAVSGSNEYAT
jgi:hypothetical protein